MLNDIALLTFLQRLQQNPVRPDTSEEAVNFSSVVPVLHNLGWDWTDPTVVIPEYVLEGRRVDFCLRTGGVSVFVEVKRPSEDLERHQKQLLEYAFSEGVHLAVLTNGSSWWFYLPTAVGSWEQRKFLVVDVVAQEPSVASESFRKFLSVDAVSTGEALGAAQALLSDAYRNEAVRKALPEVWRRLASEPDELLVELLAESTEAISGHRPDDEAVAEFLLTLTNTATVDVAHAVSRERGTTSPTGSQGRTPSGGFPAAKPVARPEATRPTVTGTVAVAYTFLGVRNEVATWKDILIGVSRRLVELHGDAFAEATTLRGRKRRYFSVDSRELAEPAQIGNSEFFAETNLSANDILKRCRSLVAMFGYPTESFSFENRLR